MEGREKVFIKRATLIGGIKMNPLLI